MSNEKGKASVRSTKSAESIVPAEWKVMKNLHSDPKMERLIQAAQRENVATEMISILGNYNDLSFDNFFGLPVRHEPNNSDLEEVVRELFFLQKNNCATYHKICNSCCRFHPGKETPNRNNKQAFEAVQSQLRVPFCLS